MKLGRGVLNGPLHTTINVAEYSLATSRVEWRLVIEVNKSILGYRRNHPVTKVVAAAPTGSGHQLRAKDVPILTEVLPGHETPHFRADRIMNDEWGSKDHT
ncbi:uncharacterized protein SPSK_02823 [Sporothrix schenckii 1099-18]|uniref:Uncharacterized protein n=1 Tax=Sporothrix schenckii 1099-18 TaxID=1397361 RepID=A0A0F2M9U1_SPOSC|nr:uncharacterized protein SPSK_02823 [Sporothrix schenckii 1099-18]KJR86422.1 hypothetical protein SPSK_02823 [Sporothrix schenckii 1099-18]